MKQVFAGGFLFLGGCILFGIGMLGMADSAVATRDMQVPMYIGAVVMIAGIILGLRGLREDD